MQKHKMIIASSVTFLSVVLVFLLGIILNDLIGSIFDLSFCALGAFLSTYILVQPQRFKFGDNLLIASGIVFSTFFFISMGHGVEQIFVRHKSVDFEPVVKFIWATLGVSWWAIPGTAYSLSILNKRVK